MADVIDMSGQPVVPPPQAELFSESELGEGRELLLAPEEQAKRFTTEHVQRNEERYRLIVCAIAEGISVRRICRAFAVSHHTVMSIRERAASLVATEKERIARSFGRLQAMTLDRLIEAVENNEIPVTQMGVLLGIVSDKKAALDGVPTQRIVVEHGIDQAAILARFEALRTTVVVDSARPDPASGAYPEIPAQIIDVSPTVSDFVSTSVPSNPDPSTETTATAVTDLACLPVSERGGGGSAPSADAGGGDGTGCRKFEHQNKDSNLCPKI